MCFERFVLRVLELERVPNARDLGGISTGDGRVVKSGLLFRGCTLADATGTIAPQESEGVSLLPRWDKSGSAKTFRPSLVYSQYEFPWGGGTEAFREFESRKAPVRGLQQMLRVGDYVALRTRMREDGAKVRLYNVVEDPFQKNDLSGLAEHRERLGSMERILKERLCK